VEIDPKKKKREDGQLAKSKREKKKTNEGMRKRGDVTDEKKKVPSRLPKQVWMD